MSRARSGAAAPASAGALLVALSHAVPLAAQRPAPADRHRVALTMSVDATGLPDALAGRCGRGDGGTLGWGTGLAALARPWRHVVVQADAHAAHRTGSPGCYADLPIVRVGPNEYETRPGADYPDGMPGEPFQSTALRVGGETTLGPLLGRAMLGGGVVWGGHRVPVLLASVAVGSHAPGLRWLVETERGAFGVTAHERRERMIGGILTPGSGPVEVVPVRLRQSWLRVRAGVEVPLGRARR